MSATFVRGETDNHWHVHLVHMLERIRTEEGAFAERMFDHRSEFGHEISPLKKSE
jgi:hypothetical protein